MTNIDNHSIPPLTQPGELIAAIPGVLGFYPQDSVVLIGFMLDDDHPHSLLLGPVMRADLDNTDTVSDALHFPPATACDVFLAVLVSDDTTSRQYKRAVSTLKNMVDAFGHPFIDACWSVPEIATGAAFYVEFGPDDDDLIGGIVDNVAMSPAMKPLLDHGALPALSRAEAFAYFQAECVYDPDTQALARLAYSRADELIARDDAGAPGADRAVDQSARIIVNAPQYSLVTVDNAPKVNDVLPEEDDLLTVLTCLARSRLRDCLVPTAVAHPRRSAPVFLAIAREFDGVIRSNALCLWAIVATAHSLSSWATAALIIVQEELPGHALADALFKALMLGDFDGMLKVVQKGAHEQRRRLVPSDGKAA
ncbi:DUF4192 domain-containing protein [Corynebacterium breve]|uniref:DUF4192 domain-containing protein n=1 Tax=Corynebacterium breve TaxID=3049799 RepID=A0ABY8VAY2_9CORY|nr:DUF4192 domain-containing protein [Corynebacterium breve]WIM66766.1 DUF4192 domain-containing protein [Corynebacterium breve]